MYVLSLSERKPPKIHVYLVVFLLYVVHKIIEVIS